MSDDREEFRRQLAKLIEHLEGRPAKTISNAVWSRVRPVLDEQRYVIETLSEGRAGQQERAEQAEQLLSNASRHLRSQCHAGRHDNWGKGYTCAACLLASQIDAALDQPGEPGPDKPRIVVHESDACQGNITGWDCDDCEDDACECECHLSEPEPRPAERSGA